MSQLVVESIWHFAGYIHITQLLNLSPIHYEGAPEFQIAGYDPDASTAQDQLAETKLPDVAPGVRNPAFLAPPPLSGKGILAIHEKLSVAPDKPLQWHEIVAPESSFSPIFPPVQLAAPSITNGSPPLPDIKVSYNIGGRQDSFVSISQTNELHDNDLVIDHEELADKLGSKDSQVLAKLQEMVSLAEREVAAPAPPFVLEGVSIQVYSTDDIEELDWRTDGNSDSLQKVASNGTFSNGVRVSIEGQDLETQATSIKSLVESLLPEGAVGEPRTGKYEPDPSDGGIPTGGAAQIAATGGNTSANAAILYDLGDAFGSRIIVGDYHETNVIAQVNVLSGATFNIPTSVEEAIGVTVAANSLRNEASFLNQPGEIYGDVSQGGYNGILEWKVDYVQGHYVDISSIVQRNASFDNDAVEITQTQAHYVVTAGENEQLNVSNLLEIGKEYDLIIIGGDYYKFNSIYQFNIVLNNDSIAQFGDTDAGTGGSILSNDAAIIDIGGSTYHPLNSGVANLVDAIADKEPIVNMAWTSGLPGPADGTFDVLYISGNYYSYNLILQSNIIVDADHIYQEASTADDVTQVASSGESAGLNGALIYNLDSQSDYQYLGGEAYEETLLVQANLIVNGDDLEGAVNEDVVAVVAAMTETNAELFDAESGGLSTHHNDVMGNILS